MPVDQIAEQFGLDKDALKGQIDFLARKAQENPELFIANPELFIETGVRTYQRMMREFLSELAFGESTRAKNMRAKLAADVYFELREKNA